MVEKRRVVLRLDHLGRGGESRLDVAVVARDRDTGILQAEAHELADARSRRPAVRAHVPFDRQELEHAVRAPPVVGDHGDGVFELHDLDQTPHTLDSFVRDGHEPAAKHRALRDRGVRHSGQLHVDAEEGLAPDLVGDVEAAGRLADESPFLGILQLRVLRRLELGGRLSHLAEAQFPPRWHMRDHAVLRVAFGPWNLPSLRRGGNEHLARRSARLAQVLLRAADRLAAAGGHRAPHPVAAHLFVGRDEFRAHLPPVALQLLRDQHGKSGGAALPHLRARHADQDAVVGIDDEPRREFGAFGNCRGGNRPRGNHQLKREAAAERRGDLEKIAAGLAERDRHFYDRMALWGQRIRTGKSG